MSSTSSSSLSHAASPSLRSKEPPMVKLRDKLAFFIGVWNAVVVPYVRLHASDDPTHRFLILFSLVHNNRLTLLLFLLLLFAVVAIIIIIIFVSLCNALTR